VPPLRPRGRYLLRTLRQRSRSAVPGSRSLARRLR
jgi:hypothetical protein